jgi:hypothetical protein
MNSVMQLKLKLTEKLIKENKIFDMLKIKLMEQFNVPIKKSIRNIKMLKEKCTELKMLLIPKDNFL